MLITGGASGIGRIMGRIALKKGAKRLVIWDISQKNIDSTLEELSPLGKVNAYIVDVSDKVKVAESYRKTVAECGDIDILINNAGIVTSNKTFDKLSEDEIIRTLNINTIAPMLVARNVLPRMLERNHGQICNITSAAGMLPDPKMSAYGASKWGAIGWSESVRVELKQMDTDVKFTTVATYYINTGMFDGVQSRLFPILDPEKTAAKIIKAVEKGKDFAGIPFGFHFIRFWEAVLPFCLFDWIFGEVCGIYHAMDHFTGRK